MSKQLWVTIDRENANAAEYQQAMDEVSEFSKSRNPVYISESADGVYLWISDEPITDAEVWEWFADLTDGEIDD